MGILITIWQVAPDPTDSSFSARGPTGRPQGVLEGRSDTLIAPFQFTTMKMLGFTSWTLGYSRVH
jgi:hypothetical protein